MVMQDLPFYNLIDESINGAFLAIDYVKKDKKKKVALTKAKESLSIVNYSGNSGYSLRL